MKTTLRRRNFLSLLLAPLLAPFVLHRDPAPHSYKHKVTFVNPDHQSIHESIANGKYVAIIQNSRGEFELYDGQPGKKILHALDLRTPKL